MAIDVKSSESVNQATNQAQGAQSDREINFEKLRRKTEALEQAIQDRDVVLKQQQQALDQFQSRFAPQDRDEFESLPNDELIDKAKLQRILQKDRENNRKQTEEIARQTYQRIDSENYQQKLYQAYPDYDQVVNSKNAEMLQEKDPEFMAALAEVKDEYKRRDMAYRKMKKLAQAEEKPKVKAQDVVNENRQNAGSYYSPGGQSPSSSPYATEFDVRSPDARKAAYERLRNAQKRGL
jgi:hypothetical protein